MISQGECHEKALLLLMLKQKNTSNKLLIFTGSHRRGTLYVMQLGKTRVGEAGYSRGVVSSALAIGRYALL